MNHPQAELIYGARKYLFNKYTKGEERIHVIEAGTTENFICYVFSEAQLPNVPERLRNDYDEKKFPKPALDCLLTQYENLCEILGL